MTERPEPQPAEAPETPQPPVEAAGAEPPEPPEPPAEPVEAEQEWRRLSRKMLLINPVTQLKNLLVPVVIGLLGTRGGDGGPPWWLFPVLGAVAAMALGLGQWYTTRYRFTEEQLQHRKGLLSRNTVTAPLDRVRSVDLEAPLLHRLLGLSKVKIGTGVDDTRIELDSLDAAQAQRLRVDLLHRSRVVGGEPATAGTGPATAGLPPDGPEAASAPTAGGWPAGDGGPAADGGDAAYGHAAYGQGAGLPVRETELVRLDPTWLKYAPFGFTGLVAAAGVIGVLGQLLGEADVTETAAAQWAVETIGRIGVFVAVAAGLVTLIVLWLVLSTVSYVLAWWNLRVTRHAEGTLHITRGLLTTRSTSLEERRVRGVSLDEPLPLRMVRGARLAAVATGVGSGGMSTLLPPSPLGVAQGLGHVVLEEDAPLVVPLRSHGPAARRRVHFRAQRWALLGIAPLLALVWWREWSWAYLVAGLVALSGLAFLSAVDRYRSLGHALTGSYLVSRSGVLVRSRVALERDGIIGWTVSESIFQRRVGLSTLTATTAAGAEAYQVVDVPVRAALRLADEATPGMLDDFLEVGR